MRAAASSMASGMPSSRRQISATADGVGLGEGETGSGPAGPVDEQLHRLAGCQPGDAGRPVVAPVMIVGDGQRRDPPGHLAGQVEGLAAGGQYAQRRTRRHQPVGQGRGRVEDVFAVVQDQQRLLVAQVGGQGVGRRSCPAPP